MAVSSQETTTSESQLSDSMVDPYSVAASYAAQATESSATDPMGAVSSTTVMVCSAYPTLPQLSVTDQVRIKVRVPSASSSSALQVYVQSPSV